MKIGSKVKVIKGFNPDLIGKEAEIVGIAGGNVEVVIKGREAMRYEIPANTVMLLDQKPEVSQEVKSADNHECKCQNFIEEAIKILQETRDFIQKNIDII